MNNIESTKMIENYMEFVDAICQMLKQQMDEEYIITRYQARKNNDTTRCGVTIAKRTQKEGLVGIEPTIYLEEYYQEYVNGWELSEVVESVLRVYQLCQEPFELTVDDFSFENLKNRICYMLVNSELNQENLNTRPHRAFWDLSVIYYVLFSKDEEGIATIPINNSLMEHWDVDEEILWNHANINSKTIQPSTFKTIQEVLHELMGYYPDETEPTLYVLTHTNKQFGAASILYDESLESILSVCDRSFYLMPSSIHEWIVIFENSENNKEMLDEFLRDVNKTQVSAEELLSNHVYYYDKEQKKVVY